MAKQNVGTTALGTASIRLIEQYQPEKSRLCNDFMAKDMLGSGYQFLFRFKFMRYLTIQATEAVAGGIYGAQVCRTRFIDDAVSLQLVSGNFQQMVILGAGLDTRAYRLPGREGVRIIEADLADVQANKKKKVRRILGKLPENVSYVPIDFITQDIQIELTGANYDPKTATIFLWEGVTQYLNEENVHQTLSFISRAKPGSMLIFTYVLRDVIERRLPGSDKLMDRMIKQGSPWTFGLAPDKVASYLEPFHMKVMEDVGAEDFQKRYLDPISRKLVLTEAERILQAVVR
jgi:methyltransferase (TIGR00027 family)